MASPHPFHERASPVSGTAAPFFPRPAPPRPAPARPAPRVPAYAFCPLAVSLDSMVKMAS